MPRMSEDQTHIQFILSRDAKRTIEECAKREGISVSTFMRRAVQQYVAGTCDDDTFDAGVDEHARFKEQ